MSNSINKANSPQEILDVVNEKDEVVGQLSRSEVHAQKLLHREIAVLIYDDQNRLLIQQRSQFKKSMPLYWMISVAGHVSSGQTPEETAHRELQEELGFNTDLKLFTKEYLDYGFEKHFAYGYLGKYPTNTQIIIDPNETNQYKFISPTDLDQMLKAGEQFEEYSLRDLRAFFSGQFDKLIT